MPKTEREAIPLTEAIGAIINAETAIISPSVAQSTVRLTSGVHPCPPWLVREGVKYRIVNQKAFQKPPANLSKTASGYQISLI